MIIKNKFSHNHFLILLTTTLFSSACLSYTTPEYLDPDNYDVKKGVCQYHLKAKHREERRLFPELLADHFSYSPRFVETTPSPSITDCITNELSDAEITIIASDNPDNLMKLQEGCKASACIFAFQPGTYELSSTLKIGEKTILISKDLSRRFEFKPAVGFSGGEDYPDIGVANPKALHKYKFSVIDMKANSAIIGVKLEARDFINARDHFTCDHINSGKIYKRATASNIEERDNDTLPIALVSIINARGATISLSEITNNTEEWYGSLIRIDHQVELDRKSKYITDAATRPPVNIQKNFLSGENQRYLIYADDFMDYGQEFSSDITTKEKNKTLAIYDNQITYYIGQSTPLHHKAIVWVFGGNVSIEKNFLSYSFFSDEMYYENPRFIKLDSNLSVKYNYFQGRIPNKLTSGFNNVMIIPYSGSYTTPNSHRYALITKNRFDSSREILLDTEKEVNDQMLALDEQGFTASMFDNYQSSLPEPKSAEEFFDQCLQLDLCNGYLEDYTSSKASTTTGMKVTAIMTIAFALFLP